METGAGGKWDRTGGTVVFKVSIFRIFRDNSRSIIHYTSHHVKSVIIDTDHIAPLGVARLAAPAADNIEKLFEVQHSERKCENISGSCAKSSALSTVLTEVGEKPSLSHIFFVVHQFSSNCRGNEQFSISTQKNLTSNTRDVLSLFITFSKIHTSMISHLHNTNSTNVISAVDTAMLFS